MLKMEAGMNLKPKAGRCARFVQRFVPEADREFRGGSRGIPARTIAVAPSHHASHCERPSRH